MSAERDGQVRHVPAKVLRPLRFDFAAARQKENGELSKRVATYGATTYALPIE